MEDYWGDPRNYDPNYNPDNPIYSTWGETPPPNPYTPPPALAPTVTAPTTAPTTTTGGGKTPQQIEQEGREYDRQHGLIGGYMMDGVWVNGSPSSSGPNTDTTGGFDLGGDPMDAPFNWSQFNPSPFSYESYVSKFGPFKAPSLQDAENEPGYQFARDQGRKTLENSAAGRGVLRTGGTLKDILAYGDKFAEQNYNGVFDRNLRTWQGNTEWDRNNYSTNRDTAFGVYDRNYRGQKDSFDALHDSEKMDFTDKYNRWKSKLDALTNLATAGANG